jgi:hypothetical protein
VAFGAGTGGGVGGAGGAATAGRGSSLGLSRPSGAASSSGAPHCSQNSALRFSGPLQKRQMAGGGAAGVEGFRALGGSGPFASGGGGGAGSFSRMPHWRQKNTPSGNSASQ